MRCYGDRGGACTRLAHGVATTTLADSWLRGRAHLYSQGPPLAGRSPLPRVAAAPAASSCAPPPSSPRAQLRSLAADELVAGAVTVLLANKSDAPGAHSPAWLASSLQLRTVLHGHPWTIVPTCALTGKGIDEGLAFLVENLL